MFRKLESLFLFLFFIIIFPLHLKNDLKILK